MLLRIDHLVIAVPDPDVAGRELAAGFGLRAAGGGRHDADGTFNRLVWLGDSYLELIAVFDRTLAGRSWIGRPTLASLDAGGGLATWAIATDSIEADVEALRTTGSDLSTPLPGERRRPDGRIVRWRRAVPPDLGALEPPFLIEHDTGSAEWTDDERAGHAAETHPIGGPVRLATLELAVPMTDLPRIAQRYLRTAGLRFRPSLAGGRARDADVGRQLVRLVPVRHGPPPPPMIRLVTAGVEQRAADLLGVRFEARGLAGQLLDR